MIKKEKKEYLYCDFNCCYCQYETVERFPSIKVVVMMSSVDLEGDIKDDFMYDVYDPKRTRLIYLADQL